TAWFADAQHALHWAPAKGTVPVSWQRGDRTLSTRLELADGWRKTDISWRASMWGLDPAPGLYGQDLSAKEKKTLGLPEKGMAFRMGTYVPPLSRAAGIKADDIIYGIDNKTPELTMLQFNAHVRLNYRVGDEIILNVLRDGERLKVPMTLQSRKGS